MAIRTYLSAKLPLLSSRGYALRHSRQPRYECEWHLHDCAMLLWPQTGGLRSAWLDDGAAPELVNAHGATLTRSSALLLPRSAAHHTRSSTPRQQHGELYLPPELLRGCTAFGALRLDGATLAMLDALLAPALEARSAEHLVQAIATQLRASRPVPLPSTAGSLPQRMQRLLALALSHGQPLPAVEAMACELGVSTRQLQRACQLELGASPVEVRRRALAARARALLAQGHSLSQASAQLGFATSGHLTRLLRAVPA